MSASNTYLGISRRRFAQLLGTSIVAASTPAAVLGVARPTTVLPVHLVYDQRILSPGHELQVINDIQVAAHHAFDGDVSVLWQRVLQRLWADHASVTLGYTRHAEFFILRTLAGEQNYVLGGLQQSADRFWWRLQPRAI